MHALTRVNSAVIHNSRICYSEYGSGSLWIGLNDSHDNDIFVWLNGSPLPDDDENWSESIILLSFLHNPKLFCRNEWNLISAI